MQMNIIAISRVSNCRFEIYTDNLKLFSCAGVRTNIKYSQTFQPLKEVKKPPSKVHRAAR